MIVDRDPGDEDDGSVWFRLPAWLDLLIGEPRTIPIVELVPPTACHWYVDEHGHRHTIHAHPRDGRVCDPVQTDREWTRS